MLLPLLPFIPPAPLTQTALTLKLEATEGDPKSLRDYSGRVILLALYGRGSGEAAGKLSADLATEFANLSPKAWVRINVADVGTAPGFMRGFVRKSVKDGAKRGEERTRQHFEALKLDYSSERAAVNLVDWKSTLAKELGVNGKTERTYQFFVIGKKGEIRFHYAQPEKPPKHDARSPLPAFPPELKDELEKALKAQDE